MSSSVPLFKTSHLDTQNFSFAFLSLHIKNSTLFMFLEGQVYLQTSFWSLAEQGGPCANRSCGCETQPHVPSRLLRHLKCHGTTAYDSRTLNSWADPLILYSADEPLFVVLHLLSKFLKYSTMQQPGQSQIYCLSAITLIKIPIRDLINQTQLWKHGWNSVVLSRVKCRL